jgi:ADP-ribosyl-[dinitrogen reductase] hydrolase
MGVRTRDLDRDLGVIIDWEPLTVISLIEQHEFSILGVAHLPQRFEFAPFDWYHCPITDLGAPGTRFEAQFAHIEPELLAQLDRGEKILLHCAAGLGRAGTIAGRLLIGARISPEDAIVSIRSARPGAIESKSQEDYLLSFTPG